MTVLSAIQAACKVIGETVPADVYAATDRPGVELAAVANTMALRIANGHDWQLLKRIHTLTGDGTTEDFDLPSDYDRMLVKAALWSSEFTGRLRHIPDADEWLGLDVQDVDLVQNAWTLYGGQIHIKPAPADDETVKFFYISNLIIAPATGSNKVAFTADTETFRLSEKLLELGIIWQWRANKGFPYAEDLANYEDLHERLIVRDGGSKTLAVGTARMPTGVTAAYPWSLGT